MFKTVKEVNPKLIMSFRHHRLHLSLELGVGHFRSLWLLLVWFYSVERQMGLELGKHNPGVLGASTTMEANIPCPLDRANFLVGNSLAQNPSELEYTLVLRGSPCGGGNGEASS